VQRRRHPPAGEEVWLIGEWRDSGEKKYYLSNRPKRTALRRLAAAVKVRWSCEQVHQQLKQELGLGDFEGRSWTGLHRHALMTCVAFAYLQHRRLKAAGRGKKGGAQRTAATAVAACDPPRRHRQAVRSACHSLSLPPLPQADPSTRLESAKVVLNVRLRNIVGIRWGMLLPSMATCLKV
jgi:hypothetical protein